MGKKKVPNEVKEVEIERIAFERQQMFGETYSEARKHAKKQVKEIYD